MIQNQSYREAKHRRKKRIIRTYKHFSQAKRNKKQQQQLHQNPYRRKLLYMYDDTLWMWII